MIDEQTRQALGELAMNAIDNIHEQFPHDASLTGAMIITELAFSQDGNELNNYVSSLAMNMTKSHMFGLLEMARLGLIKNL